ncbi:hypothetical protein BCR43DRAFT_500108 [Syncephalastrum racemosum]|uniref:Uncharacterized protein n=1 Tax=Syncephalastrum racemosum TaxID=13706 RepID=A0A1X2GYY9_SYNRA|nr:hypothetical protein BCR43DRAFT_500108 [Syncephalastrum racemosum]
MQAYLRYDPESRTARICHAGAETEPFPIHIKDSDAVGLVYVQETHNLGVVMNGEMLGKHGYI